MVEILMIWELVLPLTLKTELLPSSTLVLEWLEIRSVRTLEQSHVQDLKLLSQNLKRALELVAKKLLTTSLDNSVLDFTLLLSCLTMSQYSLNNLESKELSGYLMDLALTKWVTVTTLILTEELKFNLDFSLPVVSFLKKLWLKRLSKSSLNLSVSLSSLMDRQLTL